MSLYGRILGGVAVFALMLAAPFGLNYLMEVIDERRRA